MRLKQPFLKLPIRFDPDALAAEVRALPTSAWTPHPTGFVGNEAVRLVSPFGEPTDDIEGPMAPTEDLKRSEYIRQIMAELGAVWGRSRLMGLAAGQEVPSHIDINYYWRTHLRIHIPVVTNPGVLFTCGDETVHMAAGECWVFDSFRWHDVQNKGNDQRIHLVLDTVGGGLMPELMRAAEKSDGQQRLFRPGERTGEGLVFENVNSPKVMSPWEMRCHLAFISENAGSSPTLAPVLERIDRFIDSWAAAWARFGTDDSGLPVYTQLLQQARGDVLEQGGERPELPNGLLLERVVDELLFRTALAQPSSRVQPVSAGGARAAASKQTFRERFDRPIFIVSTPRSGSTLVYETLEKAPRLHSTGDESHWLIEGIPNLSPSTRAWSSNRLTAEDAAPDTAEQLAEGFYRHLTDRAGKGADGRVRMLEKTPKNALRVPFFDAMWPDAQFIYLYRDVREALYSMMEAWQSGGFRTYSQLPGWRGAPWSLLLVPGWQRLNGLQLPEVVAHQWAITTDTLLDDLEKLDPARIQVVDYATFLTTPQAEVERLAAGAGLSWDRAVGANLPLSKTTVSTPDRDKWRRIAPVIEAIWPIVERADARARSFLEERGARVVARTDRDSSPLKSAMA
jgi:hypothetical protein